MSERRVRYTRGRRAVVAALASSDGPKSAAELHEGLERTVPLSSLYRSLAVLEEAGVVMPHHGARTLTRYELAEWLAGHHHHLVCSECGLVEDVELPGDGEEQVRILVDGLTADAGFTALNHALEIEGTCAACS